MNFDRNTVIGFVLLGLLFIGFFWTTSRQKQEYEAQQKIVQDSIAKVKANQAALARLQDTAKVKVSQGDSTAGFTKALGGTEQKITMENELMKIVFSNKGGQPVEVELKQFKAYDSTPVKLAGDSAYNRFSYAINTGGNQSAQIADLYFTPDQPVKNADGSQTLRFHLPAPDGESIVHEYTIRPDQYLIDWNVEIHGPDKLFTQNDLNMVWQDQLGKISKNISDERRLSSVCFYEGNEFDYMLSKTERVFEKPVQWVSVSQQFFNTTLIAKENFVSGSIHTQRETADSSTGVARISIALQSKIPTASSATMHYQLYYGPQRLFHPEEAGSRHG